MNHVNVFKFFLRMDKTTTTTKIMSITEWSGRIWRNIYIYIYLEPFMYCELKNVKYTKMKLVLRNPFDAFIQIGFEPWFLRSAEVHLQLAVAFSFSFASKIVTNNSESRHRDTSCLMPVLCFHSGINLNSNVIISFNVQFPVDVNDMIRIC